VISCLGAAGRIRGEYVQLADIFDSHTCPLARMIRKRLHQLGVNAQIPAIFSPEVPCAPLPPDDNDPYLTRGRRRRQLPSVGVVPGIAGYAAAGYVLRTLAADEASSV
jgi:tRNA A37 threonylcarbamoyladenosine dehydratase